MEEDCLLDLVVLKSPEGSQPTLPPRYYVDKSQSSWCRNPIVTLLTTLNVYLINYVIGLQLVRGDVSSQSF